MSGPRADLTPGWTSGVPAVTGLIVAGLGALVLADTWAFERSASVRADVALGLLCCGLSLALYRLRPRLGRSLGAVPVLLGIALTAELATGGALAPHDLVTGTATSQDFQPHAIAAVTLITFGLARLLSATTGATRVLYTISEASFAALTLVVLMSYVFGAREVGLVSEALQNPALAALLLALMVCGLVCCDVTSPPMNLLLDAGPAGTLSRRLLPAVAIGPAALAQLHHTAERYELVGPDLGLALLTSAMVVGLAVIVSITALNLRRSEVERLKMSRELEAVFASIPAAVSLTDIDSNYVRTSPFTEREMLSDGGSLRGRNARDFYPAHLREALIAQEDLAREQGITSTCEYQDLRDGELREWELTRFPVADESGSVFGIGTVGVDITARKRAERAAAEASERLRSYLDAAPDATIMVDRIGVIQYANRRVAELLAFEPGEMVGMSVDRLVPEPAHTGHSDLRASYLRDPGHREMGSGKELLALRKDGSTVAVEISLGPVETEDGTWIAAALRDVTERRAADLALRRAEQRARYLADHDPLTGATNRRWFEMALAKHLGEAGVRRGGLLIVDVDHFKQVNDTAGHAAGDALLVDIVQTIGTCLPAGATLSRLGGDEFAVILATGGTMALRAVAESIVVAVRRAGLRAGLAVLPTASIGAAPFEALLEGRPGSTAALVAADDALYAAKAGGRDQAVVWTPAVRRPRSVSRPISQPAGSTVSHPGGDVEPLRPRVVREDAG